MLRHVRQLFARSRLSTGKTGLLDRRLPLSVVVPVYNDPAGIETTLQSLTDQTRSASDYEVLVVDNGSDDGTRDVVRTYRERYPELVSLLVEDEIQSSYAARNEGVRHARGQIIAFVDADMTVDETWAESVVASFREHGWDYMGSEIETYVDGPESLTALYDRTLGGFPVEFFLEERNFTVTACLAVRREVFEEVGLFDPRFTSQGDGEFGKRVHAAGFDQHFEPGITMYHPTRTTLSAWLRKQIRIGRGAMQKRTYTPERVDRAERSHPLSPRKFLPPRPGRFYARLSDATNPNLQTAVGLYALDYLTKLARAVGAVLEWLEQSRTGTRPKPPYVKA
ncbi:glycosyltransferase family 2 [Natronococcus pandeyae]|uniref:Glycosyltransferase family 2 n=1 Tax=Natronococcus pandeyae TaxID=2055836 RepID=A0A8J8Q7T2_9EURY|nr:glycosyltransferase [Natronococcus pandeyae]TYL38880.1 glycosyltransferase family 2 [Natronococcus pandeyae]